MIGFKKSIDKPKNQKNNFNYYWLIYAGNIMESFMLLSRSTI